MSQVIPFVEVNNITKSFGSVVALDGVSIQAIPGEVTAIVGDNGAGKSTLIKCISGVIKPDSGQIFLSGEEITFKSPQDARLRGIETVYQTLGLIEDLSIWQNLFLNREKTRNYGPIKTLAKRAMRDEATQMLRNLDVHIPSIKSRVRGLSGGQRQAVAISRAAGWSSKVVVLDEPTAALGVREAGHVEDLIKQLRNRGLAIILISHNFDQVLRLADSIYVMRQGRVLAGMLASQTSGTELVSLITGAQTGQLSGGN